MAAGAEDRDGGDSTEALIPIGRYRCFYLVLALVGLLALYPYLGFTGDGRILLNLLNLIVMGGALATVRRQPLSVLRVVLLVLLVLGLQIWHLIAPAPVPFLLLCVAMSGLYGLVVVGLLAYLLRREPITPDKLYAGIAGYILIGIFFAALLRLLQDLDPRAFSVDPSVQGPPEFFDFIYVSFGTLTTAGFTGLTPVLQQARSLLVLEEITGFVYAALLVARLTSLYRPGG